MTFIPVKLTPFDRLSFLLCSKKIQWQTEQFKWRLSNNQVIKWLWIWQKRLARELGLSCNTVESYLAEDSPVVRIKKSERQESLFGFFPY
jgi:hypothetical protein